MRQKKNGGLVVLASLCIVLSALGGVVYGIYVFVRNTGYYLVWDHSMGDLSAGRSPCKVHHKNFTYVGDFDRAAKYDEPQGRVDGSLLQK
jgi:hypothetical protein